MPDQANNQDGIFGSTANVNGQSAIESVQAEEIRRLQQQKVQAEAAIPNAIPNPPLITPGEILSLSPPSPVDVPLTAAQMMQEASREAQARTDAALARAAQFDATSAAGSPSGPIPMPPSAGRTSFDAVAANARAAAQGSGFPAPPSQDVKVTSSAAGDAGTRFDAAAYDQSIRAQMAKAGLEMPTRAEAGGVLSQAEYDALMGKRPAASDPALAASPSSSASSPSEDLWASQNQKGRVDASIVSATPEMRSQLESLRPSAVASRAGSEEASRPTYASYEAAQQAKADILSDARNLYASRGEYGKIGKAGFNAEVKAAEISQGLQEPKERGFSGALDNIREDLKSPYGAIQYGYGANSLLEGATHAYAASNSGQYLTPEQRQSAAAGLLPGAFTLAGTVAGSVVPGLGSWAGSIVGAGIGTVAQGVLDAGFEREQSVRQTGEIYSNQTGASADALKEFTEALRSTSAATKEVQAAFNTLASAGPGMASSTLPGVAFMSGALGERYNPALSGLTHAVSSDPLLRALQPQINATGGRFAGGMAGGQTLGDIAAAEAFSGDWQASSDAATLAEGALTNPRYAEDMNRHTSAFSFGGIYRQLNPITSILYPMQNSKEQGSLFRLWTGQDDQYVAGGEAQKAQIAKDRADAYKLYTQGASADEVAKTGVGLASARLGIAENQGATDAQLAQTAQGLYGAVAGGVPKLTQEAAGIDGYLADHPNMDAATRLKLQETRDTALTNAEGMEQQQAQTQKALFGRSLETEQSGFSLSVAQSVYSGQSVSARAGIVRRQEDFLSGVADNPGPLSPAERNQIRADVLKQRYDFQEEGFGENAASYGLTQAGDRATLTRGVLSGKSYGDLQGEEDRSLSTDRARAVQLRSEANAAGVPYAERLQKLTQATGLETQAQQQQHDFLLSRYGQNLAQTDLQGAQAGLAVTNAQITGGPQDVYGARGQELDAYKAKIAELSSELSKGGMTLSERIDKERQLTDTRREAAQASFGRDQSLYNDQYQLTGTGEQALEVGQSRRLRRGGNAAFDPALLDAGKARTSEAQSHLDFDVAHYGGNKQLLADDRLRVAQSQEDYQGLLDVKNDYRPTGAFARQMASDRTAFEVALEAPYIRGGSESNPLTRGNAVIKDIRQDMAQNEANRLRGQRDGTWTDDNETAYSQHKNEDALQLASMEREKRFALFNAIPNTIIGGGAMGNSVQSLSFDALTAEYAPNVLVGSRGRPDIPRGGNLPGSLPGNAVEAFQQHAAGSAGTSGSSPASLTAAIQTLTHGLNNQQLASLLTQLLQSNQELVRLVGSGQRLPGQGGPPLNGGSRTNQDNRQNANTNRPSLR